MTLVRDTLSTSVCHNSIMIIYQKMFKLWPGHEIASETIKGK